ncbi:MAG: peptidoglycan DD-metalloendopeptidase family protein [Nitrospirae bacterium]|nr:peptidoglycan DD-metalloendopeptidase family protein [Nitrospirota bacterium]
MKGFIPIFPSDFDMGNGRRPLIYTIIKKALPAIFILTFLVTSCASPPPSRKDAKGVYHKIKEGQTLWRIAKTYNVDLEHLAKINNLEDATEIKTGEWLFIPGAEKALEVEIYKPDEIKARKVSIPPFGDREIFLIWPITGKMTSPYGNRNGKMHDGIDISVPKGTPIKAAADGRVTFSGRGYKDYGKMVIIDHNSEFQTIYAHNSENLVDEGDEVKKGQIIGKVGDSGNATGYHLHFEVRKWGKPLNPFFFLP